LGLQKDAGCVEEEDASEVTQLSLLVPLLVLASKAEDVGDGSNASGVMKNENACDDDGAAPRW